MLVCDAYDIVLFIEMNFFFAVLDKKTLIVLKVSALSLWFSVLVWEIGSRCMGFSSMCCEIKVSNSCG